MRRKDVGRFERRKLSFKSYILLGVASCAISHGERYFNVEYSTNQCSRSPRFRTCSPYQTCLPFRLPVTFTAPLASPLKLTIINRPIGHSIISASVRNIRFSEPATGEARLLDGRTLEVTSWNHGFSIAIHSIFHTLNRAEV